MKRGKVANSDIPTGATASQWKCSGVGRDCIVDGDCRLLKCSAIPLIVSHLFPGERSTMFSTLKVTEGVTVLLRVQTPYLTLTLPYPTLEE
jgi:hypothetical protein